MNKIMSFVLLFLSISVFSDAPLPSPETWKLCNTTISFCASLDPKSNTASIYKIEDNFESKSMYKISGWSRSALLSENGDYFILGYDGLNLVPKSVEKSQVILTIYKSGIFYREITLGQIIENFSSLKETLSHYHWGSIDSLYGNNLNLKTVEGSVSINIETGIIKRYKK